MIKTKIFLLTFCCFFYASIHAQTRNILFIGNSITYFNNMPQTVAALSEALGDTLQVTMYAPGGTGFLNHVVDPAVYQHFRTGNWDYVVLQPGSNESPAYSEPLSSTIARGKQLRDSIHTYSPCAQVILYEISYGIANNTPQALTSYTNTQALIRNNLMILADSMKTYLAPAGETVRNAFFDRQSLFLWNGYGDIHPDPYGSYAIASAIAGTICKKSVYGLRVYIGLDSAKCTYLQHKADSVVWNGRADWRFGQYTPYAHFKSIQTGALQFQFQPSPSVADSVRWSFGDNTSSTQAAPSKTYNAAGTYTPSLFVYRRGCADRYDTVIHANALVTGIQAHEASAALHLYPNPANTRVQLQALAAGASILYNMQGQAIRSGTISPGVNTLDLSGVSPGMYILQVIYHNGALGRERLLIVP